MNPIRVRAVNSQPPREDGEFLLYWMTAFRRARWNYSLDRAVDEARRRRKPLVVLEALRSSYRWASERFHRFLLDGMEDNRKAFETSGVLYYPYLEPRPGDGSGLLESLARRSVMVVTDDFPCFFLPRMVEAAGRKLAALGIRLEAVDGNGLYPMRDTDRVFTTAHSFRRHLQARLPFLLEESPRARRPGGDRFPAYRLPRAITERWRPSLSLALETIPIDHRVAAARERGGEGAARVRLRSFLEKKLHRYQERNHPDTDVASGLSPYLHFGHISSQEIFWRLAAKEEWTPDRLATRGNGSRAGWWGMSPPAESFLDELVTWRELGFNLCVHRSDYDRYPSLPDWARATLSDHEGDERPNLYDLDKLAQAETHDPLWNAAQRQLVIEGRLHNYLRMLWGKKILEWSKNPRKALEVMIELNNRYALDGRDPNSYSGIFWVLGRYDRAWGPERPIFGKIRYMSSENTARKLRLAGYLETYG